MEDVVLNALIKGAVIVAAILVVALVIRIIGGAL